MLHVWCEDTYLTEFQLFFSTQILGCNANDANTDPAHMTHYNSIPQAPTQQHSSPQYSVPQTFASSASMSQSPHNQHGSQSPFEQQYYQGYAMERRPSITSNHSYGSFDSDSKDKPACPECGKRFKDMKAHMMTHQTIRPEKCPVVSCSFHRKGFARKYDQQRHTLTHYKGTMVCPLLPRSWHRRGKVI